MDKVHRKCSQQVLINQFQRDQVLPAFGLVTITMASFKGNGLALYSSFPLKMVGKYRAGLRIVSGQILLKVLYFPKSYVCSHSGMRNWKGLPIGVVSVRTLLWLGLGVIQNGHYLW